MVLYITTVTPVTFCELPLTLPLARPTRVLEPSVSHLQSVSNQAKSTLLALTNELVSQAPVRVEPLGAICPVLKLEQEKLSPKFQKLKRPFEKK